MNTINGGNGYTIREIFRFGRSERRATDSNSAICAKHQARATSEDTGVSVLAGNGMGPLLQRAKRYMREAIGLPILARSKHVSPNLATQDQS
jgi:hypothetical protein